MGKDISKLIKSTILEVLKEEKQKQLNEFNPSTGRFEDEGLSSEQKKLTSEKISKLGVYKTTLDASTFTSVNAMLSGMTSVATFFTNLITSSTAIFRPPGFYWSEFNLPN